MARNDIVVDTELLETLPHEIEISGSRARHFAKAKRLRTGEEAVIKDGMGLSFMAKLKGVGPDTITFKVLSPLACPDDTIPVVLVPSVIKGKRMDWLIQKACELGVREIRPVITDRTVANPRGMRVKRWREIAVQALQQCSGNRLTRIHEPVSLDELLDNLVHLIKIILLEADIHPPLLELVDNIREFPGTEIAVLVGPEGGFTSREITKCLDREFKSASLGIRILRTETAAIATAAILRALYEQTVRKIDH